MRHLLILLVWCWIHWMPVSHILIMRNLSNGTETGLIQTQASFTHTQILAVVIYCVIFVLSVTANGLVIYATGFKMKTTVNSVRFLNLAMANFFYSFTITFRVIRLSLSHEWPLGELMCTLIPFFRYTCLFASIFLLTVISFDRCLTVWMVVWARNKRSPTKARLICAFVWFISMAFSVPSVQSRTLINNTCIRNVDSHKAKCLAMFNFMVGFLIPLVIITCCCMAICVHASQIKREKKIRPFLIILAAILNFFLFWLPIHVINLFIPDQKYSSSSKANLFSGDVNNLERKMSLVSPILAFLYSCLNPFLYMFMCAHSLNRN